jgi:O-antigen ligase
MNVDRVIGYTHTTDDPNALGMTLVSALPFALIFLADKKQGIFRAVILGCVLLSVWTVVETASRTSFFTLVLMIVIVALRSSKRMVLLPVGLIMLALIWTVMPAQYRDRYETVQSLEKDMSYQNRRIAWGAGVHMFFDRPLTGIGTGQFAVAAGTKYWPNTLGRRKIWLQPHSLYFQVIAELGLLGALAFGTLVFSAFRENLRLRRRLMELPDAAGWLRDLPSACLLCMALLLVAGYSGHNLYRQTWYFVFGITAAMFGILNKAKENELILPPLPTEDAMVGGAIMNDKSRARCMTLPSFIRMEGGVVAELPRPDTHP